jgi:proline racemase
MEVRATDYQTAGEPFRIVTSPVPEIPGDTVADRFVPGETRKGTVHADLAYGGAGYASADARSAGLTVSPRHYQDLIAVGREIKWALDEAAEAQHPSDPRLSGVYGKQTTAEGRPAVVPEVRGSAHITGEHVFILDPRDDLESGFVLR